jgi:hypothetical protein
MCKAWGLGARITIFVRLELLSSHHLASIRSCFKGSENPTSIITLGQEAPPVREAHFIPASPSFQVRSKRGDTLIAVVGMVGVPERRKVARLGVLVFPGEVKALNGCVPRSGCFASHLDVVRRGGIAGALLGASAVSGRLRGSGAQRELGFPEV